MDANTLYVLRIADACLIHGQRLAEWCGHAPVLEEDIALTNVALDHIGQARSLLALAGVLEGRGRDEDALAFLRADLVLLTKMDLAPHLDIDLDAMIGNLAKVRPDPRVIMVSAKTGAGIADWLTWLTARRAVIGRAA